MYIVAALFYVAAAVGGFADSPTWATWLCLGSLWMLLASSKLTKIGKELREEEEKKEKE